jgi:hypothetical protein
MNIHLQKSIERYREKIALLKEHLGKKAYYGYYTGLRLAEGEEFLFYIGQTDCALCEEYRIYGCDRCPVFEKTGETGCENTPWKEIWIHCQKEVFFITKKFINLFEKELAFLEGLQSE